MKQMTIKHPVLIIYQLREFPQKKDKFRISTIFWEHGLEFNIYTKKKCALLPKFDNVQYILNNIFGKLTTAALPAVATPNEELSKRLDTMNINERHEHISEIIKSVKNKISEEEMHFITLISENTCFSETQLNLLLEFKNKLEQQNLNASSMMVNIMRNPTAIILYKLNEIICLKKDKLEKTNMIITNTTHWNYIYI